MSYGNENSGNPPTAPKSPKSSGGGGGGKSGKSKETEEAKKAQKAEEELQKSRTNAYKDAQKLSEKYQNIVVDTTKKMAEQKKKMEEIRQSAIDTIADIDEQLADKKDTYQEKIAKRYSETFKELKEFFREDNLRPIFAHYKDNDFKKMFAEWELSETDTSDFAKNIREFQYIQKNLDAEELTLAVKKEQRSEAEKLTEEYKEQKALLENSLAMNEAVRAGRYVTNSEGGLSFFDEKGNAIEGMGNKQRKEFKEMAKKLQDVADAELKIQTEKEEKIFQIYKEFDDERKRLNEGYFEKDKEMRVAQEEMKREFFANEIARMVDMRAEAIRLTEALIRLRSVGGQPASVFNTYNSTTNNSNSTQNVSVNTVADVNSINKALGTKLSKHRL
nr:MAG TPA: hypothetical protein [Caudoviricetes sp.]